MVEGYLKNLQMGSAVRRALFRLSAVCGKYEAACFSAVPLEDVLEVEALPGAWPMEKPLTFDFLICQKNGKPVFALDICRRSARKAGKAYREKDRLTLQGGLPYFRVHSAYFADESLRLSLISWCAEQWFVKNEQLVHKKAEGHPDLPPTDLFSTEFDAQAWPANLFAELEYRLSRMKSWMAVACCRLEYELGKGAKGGTVGLGTLLMDDDWGLVVRCEIFTQHAEGMESDLMRIILIKHLLSRFRRFELGGKCKKRKEILRRRRKFRKRCTVVSTGLFGWGF